MPPKLIIKKRAAPSAEETLLNAEKAYFETGVPIMDDAEYDALTEVALREGTAAARPVGFRPMGEKQIVLPFPMPSLEKIKPGERRLADWLGSKSSSGYVISDKLDGVSALWCSSASGTEPRLFQRGDQQVGVEITQYTPYVSGLASLPQGAAVRGEIVLRRTEGVVSPADRNIVNGVLHRGDPDVASQRETLPGKLVFVGYEVLSPRMARSSQMRWMTAHGFEVAHHQIITDGDLTQEFLIDILKRRRAEGEYPIDGIVVGRGGVPAAVTSDMKYPVDCVAFKMPMADQMAETVVRAVEWNLTRMGYYVPRMSLEPVEIGGVTISWVTGHNAQWVRERGIGVGARVVIRRSGDVIPIIDSVLEEAEELAAPGPEGGWKMEGVHAVPVEAASLEERGGTARHFDYMMTQLGVKQFGPARLEAMKEAGVEDFAHMCQLEESVWADVLGKGIGPKLRAAVLAASGVASRRQKLACYPWPTDMTVGTTRIIAAEDMLESGRKDKPDGFSAGAWERYLAELPAAEKWCAEQFGSIQPVIHSGAVAVAPKPKKVASQAKGVICMTGFRDAALQARLEEAGYAVAAWGTKTTILLVPSASENNKKIQEAREKGIRIVSRADAEQLLA